MSTLVEEMQAVMASGPFGVPPHRREIVLAALEGFHLGVSRCSDLVAEEMRKFRPMRRGDIPEHRPTEHEIDLRAQLRALDEMFRAFTSGEVKP